MSLVTVRNRLWGTKVFECFHFNVTYAAKIHKKHHYTEFLDYLPA